MANTLKAQFEDDGSLGVPKHNKWCEKVFGYFDRMLRDRPNITIIAAEAFVMWTYNRTAEWLCAKSDEEQDKLCDWACKEATRCLCVYHQRQQTMKVQKQLKVLNKINATLEKREKKTQKDQKCLDDVEKVGVWSLDEIDSKLEMLPHIPDKVDAIKAQIWFLITQGKNTKENSVFF